MILVSENEIFQTINDDTTIQELSEAKARKKKF